jgi:hypothetical protein
MTNPGEILKFCLGACRQETVHRLVSGISTAYPLYACTGPCGSPARAVSDPANKTRGAAFLRDCELKRWRKESEQERVYDELHPQRQARQTPAKEKRTMGKDTPLVKLIKQVVTSMGGITEGRVREIFREEIEAQLPGEAAATEGDTLPAVNRDNCPRMPHKGQHGKACREALAAQSA